MLLVIGAAENCKLFFANRTIEPVSTFNQKRRVTITGNLSRIGDYRTRRSALRRETVDAFLMGEQSPGRIAGSEPRSLPPLLLLLLLLLAKHFLRSKGMANEITFAILSRLHGILSIPSLPPAPHQRLRPNVGSGATIKHTGAPVPV